LGKIKLTKVEKRAAFRKMAVGSWDTVADPSVYSFIDIDMTNALKYMKDYNDAQNVRVTPTHLVGHVIAKVIEKRPEINAMLRGSCLYQREDVGVFFLVNIPCERTKDTGNSDLSGCTIHGVEKLELNELVEKISDKIDKIRTNNDGEITATIKMLDMLPWSLSKFALRLISFLNYGLNLDLEWLGIPKNPFGSVMITNVGSLGVDNALAPLTPHSRSPLFLTVGKINDRPWVVDGEIKVRPVMTIGVTFDHRFMDGSHGAKMVALFKDYMESPEDHLSPSKKEIPTSKKASENTKRLNVV
jgi:pyruvate dehydrogenase E2 component (dihydrolipoamide acetyltransferase)